MARKREFVPGVTQLQHSLMMTLTFMVLAMPLMLTSTASVDGDGALHNMVTSIRAIPPITCTPYQGTTPAFRATCLSSTCECNRTTSTGDACNTTNPRCRTYTNIAALAQLGCDPARPPCDPRKFGEQATLTVPCALKGHAPTGCSGAPGNEGIDGQPTGSKSLLIANTDELLNPTASDQADNILPLNGTAACPRGPTVFAGLWQDQRVGSIRQQVCVCVCVCVYSSVFAHLESWQLDRSHIFHHASGRPLFPCVSCRWWRCG